MTDKEFFDAPSPLNDRDNRRDALNDYSSNMEDEISSLRDAVGSDDLEKARKHFEEMKGWLDAIDDNLCEREEDGSRKD